MAWVLLIFLNGRLTPVEFTTLERCQETAQTIREVSESRHRNRMTLDLICAER